MKRNILILTILATSLFGLFALFIHINELKVRADGQHKTEYFGQVMKNYLWSLDKSVAEEYATVVATETGFHDITIIDSNQEEFLSVKEIETESGSWGVLKSLGLVHDIEFSSYIYHEKTKIGVVITQMRNKSIYTYLYIFVCLVLILCLVGVVLGGTTAKRKRKLAELELSENRKKLQRVVSNAPVIAFSLDREMRFTVCEGRALRKLKAVDENPIGKNVSEIFGENERIKADFYRALGGESFSNICRLGDKTYDICYSPALEKGEIQGIAAVATDVTELKITLDELASRDKLIQGELEIARKTHQAMVPTKLPELDGFEFGLVFKPWGGLGGDFISFKKMNDGRLGVAFADISGHGVSAALLSSVFHVVLDDVMSQDLPLSESFLKLNRKLVDQFPEDRFASTFYAIFDADTQLMCWVKAAQEPAIHFRPGEQATLIKEGGPVLGIIPPELLKEDSYVEECLKLEEGDTVFLYTDGLLEVEDSEGVMIERDTLVDWIEELVHLAPQELCEEIYKKVLAYAANKELADDVAVFAARVSYSPLKQSAVETNKEETVLYC